jgi:hypothetical protein
MPHRGGSWQSGSPAIARSRGVPESHCVVRPPLHTSPADHAPQHLTIPSWMNSHCAAITLVHKTSGRRVVELRGPPGGALFDRMLQ